MISRRAWLEEAASSLTVEHKMDGKISELSKPHRLAARLGCIGNASHEVSSRGDVRLEIVLEKPQLLSTICSCLTTL